VIENLTVVLALPESTCAGLKEQVLSEGNAEQERATSSGKVPLEGVTSRL
jgi:hypothetical protein